MQKVILGLTFIVFIGGCTSAPQGEGSFLIVTINNFRADALNCGALPESLTPNLDGICAEGVRFTHAYTPSVMTNAALASLLTGLYPFEHGIRRDGASRYVEGVKSVPQWARELGRETILVSGGVPVLRKAGIGKGFGDFDDSIRIGDNFYRPAGQVVETFLNLLELRAQGVPFFGVLHMADLLFPELPSLKKAQTENQEGAYNGKLQEIDDALGQLKATFTKMKIWDSLTVVVVGLQGVARTEHEGLAKGLNLHNEVIQVPLLIKPARKKRDLAPSWKVDDPVTLVDLGVTLLELLGVTEYRVSRLPTLDFIPALEGHALNSPVRPIFSESDLAVWRGWGPRLVSVRYGELMYWPHPEPKLYNTYTDRLEQHNLFSKDFTAYRQMEEIWQRHREFIDPLREQHARSLPYSLFEKLRVARNIFSKYTALEEKNDELLELEIRRPEDWQVFQWHALTLLEGKDWAGLNQVIRGKKNLSDEQREEAQVWQMLARIHLRSNEEEFQKSPDFNCLNLAVELKRLSYSEIDQLLNQNVCRDLETKNWLHSYAAFKGRRNKEASNFFELANNITIRREEQKEFAKAFWMDGATWDYPSELPKGPAFFEGFVSLVTSEEFLDYIKRKQAP